MSYAGQVSQCRMVLAVTLCLACALSGACSGGTPGPLTTPTVTPTPEATYTPQASLTPEATSTLDATPSEPSGDEPIAVLTSVKGQVTVERSQARRLPGLAAPSAQGGGWAVPYQPLYLGTSLYLAPDAGVTMVCFNDYYLAIQGQTTVSVSYQNCQTGTRLPQGYGRSVRPGGDGRIRASSGSFVWEEPAREAEGDYGRIPVILAPRNTALLEREPPLRWTGVSGALEYVLSMSGPEAFVDQQIDVEDLSCVEDARAAPGLLCSLPWPSGAWTLQEGKTYFLTVSARISLASALRASDTSVLKPLTAEQATQLSSRIADLQALDLDPTTRDVLLGGLYVEHGIYNQAIEAYERALKAQTVPVLYLAVGDAYREVELNRPAYTAYKVALDLLGEDGEKAQRAAIEYGIGQIEFAGMNYAEAAKHFGLSVDLYRDLEAIEFLQAAQTGLDEATKRQQ